MLVWFCIRAKLRAHTLKASLPCLPLPLHRPSPFLQPLQKNTYHLARSSRCTEYCHPPQPLQKNNNPSLSTTSLPCLPPLHRILLPSHLSFLFNILITANFNFAINYIAGIVSSPSLDFPSRTISPTLFDFLSSHLFVTLPIQLTAIRYTVIIYI